MDDLHGLTLEPMPNRLVNYGVTNNGIAVIELTSDSAGAPIEGTNDRSPNTYTCLLYTSPSPRDKRQSRMPSSA